ncbi:hypothetical protein EDB85DRAFT_1414462 [Lactarius pseudohatsudake]|nr:hypothetical protein EDB85DRAFT_1414462 [Lactarius pseudohatsudake]
MGLRYTRHRLQVISRSYDHWLDSLLRHCRCRRPLRLSSQSGHHDVVQCLIDHGADVNSQEDHNTPLNWAAHGGRVDVVECYLNTVRTLTPNTTRSAIIVKTCEYGSTRCISPEPVTSGDNIEA